MKDRKTIVFEVIVATVVAILILIVIWGLLSSDIPELVPATAIVSLALIGFFLLRYAINPDHLRASESDRTFYIARKLSEILHEGLDGDAAKEVCELVLPHTSAVAVCITDTEKVLGAAGANPSTMEGVDPRRETRRLIKTVSDEKVHMLLTPEDAGINPTDKVMKAAIVAPLIMRNEVVGGIKFFYRSPRKIDETQRAMAEGLSELISSQLSVSELEKQTELATRMELKALQAQINPHFLFNTINTIASLIRTDPERARVLLREFAVFYRRTLENSQDLIAISDELEQTVRYFGFETARFGEERLELNTHIDKGLESVQVPSFIIQPIVENCVIHGMRDSGKLHVKIDIRQQDDFVVIAVSDDGVGIKPEALPRVLEPGYGTGMGVALKNVDDRLKGYFDSASGINIESNYGEGTTVYLSLHDAL